MAADRSHYPLADMIRELADLIEGSARLDDEALRLQAVSGLRRLVALAQAGLLQLDAILEAVEDGGGATRPATAADDAGAGPSGPQGASGDENWSYDIEIDIE